MEELDIEIPEGESPAQRLRTYATWIAEDCTELSDAEREECAAAMQAGIEALERMEQAL